MSIIEVGEKPIAVFKTHMLLL